VEPLFTSHVIRGTIAQPRLRAEVNVPLGTLAEWVVALVLTVALVHFW
jgi:hypothetical protein